MLEAYGLRDAEPAALPMTPGSVLTPSDGKGSNLPYRALLGQLHWVAGCTRPDIVAAGSAFSRFYTTYGAEHFVALKQVVRYLKGTLQYELMQRCVFLSTTEVEIIAMSEGAREVKYILNVLDGLVYNTQSGAHVPTELGMQERTEIMVSDERHHVTDKAV
ncbi:hypothetical protein CYMTET_35906 [Cymbomonas tetramitiformis]|uniref:Uncharacterized protein n=1 Tax=Cymbomonas tetramitiformis TaxID=36881 RepID=A0AAE0KN34_9CHLO|nr:hypothetical protein CYMTET_35906 [Cymbomonas tetramitiformis]